MVLATISTSKISASGYAKLVHLWYTTAKFSCSLLQLFPNLESSLNANVYKGIIRISLQSVEVGCKARSALLTRRSAVGLRPGPPSGPPSISRKVFKNIWLALDFGSQITCQAPALSAFLLQTTYPVYASKTLVGIERLVVKLW